jgi:hypothetical protein
MSSSGRNELPLENMNVGPLFFRVKDPEGQTTVSPRNCYPNYVCSTSTDTVLASWARKLSHNSHMGWRAADYVARAHIGWRAM